MLATRNPRICELMCRVPFSWFENIFRRLTTGVPGPNPVARPWHQKYRCRFWARPNDYLVKPMPKKRTFL
jgi:hypothetical protein